MSTIAVGDGVGLRIDIHGLHQLAQFVGRALAQLEESDSPVRTPGYNSFREVAETDLRRRGVLLADVRAQVALGAEHISFGDPDFLNGPALGGIMITEPGVGTDVFGLSSSIAVGDEAGGALEVVGEDAVAVGVVGFAAGETVVYRDVEAGFFAVVWPP